MQADPAIPTLRQIVGHAWGKEITSHSEMERYLKALVKGAPDRAAPAPMATRPSTAATDVGASVTLTLRSNPQEDHFIYNAAASGFLQGLAEGEKHTNRFYYAVRDRNDGIGIGAIDMIVDGVNNTPFGNPDPDSLEELDPLVSSSNTRPRCWTRASIRCTCCRRRRGAAGW